MDASRFDSLTRNLATSSTRRRILASLAAGVLGLARTDWTGARACASRGAVCRESANCCSGLCGDRDATGRRRCICRPDKVLYPAGVCRRQGVRRLRRLRRDLPGRELPGVPDLHRRGLPGYRGADLLPIGLRQRWHLRRRTTLPPLRSLRRRRVSPLLGVLLPSEVWQGLRA